MATELLSLGTGSAGLASWPLAYGPQEKHWLKGSGRLSLATFLGLAVEEESVFKFQVTVSVAPRPENSEAKLERAVYALGVHKEGGHMWPWVVRDGKEKLMGLVLGDTPRN